MSAADFQRHLASFDEHATGTFCERGARTSASKCEDHGQPWEQESESELAHRFWSAEGEPMSAFERCREAELCMHTTHDSCLPPRESR